MVVPSSVMDRSGLPQAGQAWVRVVIMDYLVSLTRTSPSELMVTELVWEPTLVNFTVPYMVGTLMLTMAGSLARAPTSLVMLVELQPVRAMAAMRMRVVFIV